MVFVHDDEDDGDDDPVCVCALWLPASLRRLDAPIGAATAAAVVARVLSHHQFPL